MKISRRDFIHAGCVAGAASLVPHFLDQAEAGLHFHGTNPFNGGKSQANFNFMGIGAGDYPFINIVKTAADWTTSNIPVSPAIRDVNGYPTSGDYTSQGEIPPTTVRPGDYVCRWIGGNGSTVMRNPGTLVIGSTSGNNGRFVFTPNPSSIPQVLNFGVNTMGIPYISDLAVMHVDDEAAWLSGQIFGTQFKNRLRQANFGVYRFLNWMGPGNTSNMTTWATRRPKNYFTYTSSEYRSNAWAGATTNAGNDYSLTFGSGAPVDKQTVQLSFNANSAYISSGAPGSVTFSGTTTVNWTAHGRAAGEPIALSGNPPLGLFTGITYYVLASGLTTNSFSMSRTPGGAAVAVNGAGGSASISASRLCTLNLNGTGAVPIKTAFGDATGDITFLNTGPRATQIVGASDTGITLWGTFVYDADLNSWLKNGADGTGWGGLNNGCPFEIMVQLCAEMGAHPWFPAPLMAIDPMTDWHTQAAAYVRTSGPIWMIPRFEGCNELWNFGNNFWQTRYAWNKAFVHWGGQFDQDNWQGKTVSTIGQAVNAAYGSPAIGTGYQVVCGVWTGGLTFQAASAFDNRLTAAAYVVQPPSAQTGYTKSPASNWATHIACANYFNAAEEATAQETTDADTFALNAAKIVGSISGNTLTVSSVTNGTLVMGQALIDQYGLIAPGTVITGGSGTSWTLNNSQTIVVGTIMFATNTTANNLAIAYADSVATAGVNAEGISLIQLGSLPATFVGSISTTVLTVSSVSSGTVVPGQMLSGTGVADANTILSQASGTPGGAGTYNLSKSNTLTSRAFVSAGIYYYAYAWCQGFTNSAGTKIKMTGYEGGYSPDYAGYSAKIVALRDASKRVTDVGKALIGGTFANAAVVNGTYNDFITIGGEFPSCFQFSGTGDDWSVLDPDVYVSPLPGQWNAIVTFNH